jgi:preprotein translocase subunit YajC
MAIIVVGRLMTLIYMVIFFALMYYYMSINKDEEYTIRAMQPWPQSRKP